MWRLSDLEKKTFRGSNKFDFVSFLWVNTCQTAHRDYYDFFKISGKVLTGRALAGGREREGGEKLAVGRRHAKLYQG